MSSNVGLSTPRGSGTSGYVQRNLSLLKPRAVGTGAPYAPLDARPPKTRKPDQEILTHDRMREIEIKILDLRDKLEEAEELDEDAIDAECETLRTKLTEEMNNKRSTGPVRGTAKKYQVHELAEAKIKESERLRRALGLKGDEIGGADGEGGEHPMARQDRRRREREEVKARDGLEREERDIRREEI